MLDEIIPPVSQPTFSNEQWGSLDITKYPLITIDLPEAQQLLSEKSFNRAMGVMKENNFDPLVAAIDVFRFGNLKDKDKATLCLKLMEYMYPKMVPVGEQRKQEDGNGKNNNMTIQMVNYAGHTQDPSNSGEDTQTKESPVTRKVAVNRQAVIITNNDLD